LATIRNEKEDRELTKYLKPGYKYIDSTKPNEESFVYWIGLNEIKVEGMWKWSSKEPVSYLNWKKGEPNNFGRNMCPNNSMDMRKGPGCGDEDCTILKRYTGRNHPIGAS